MLNLDFKGWFLFKEHVIHSNNFKLYSRKNLALVTKQIMLVAERMTEHFKEHNL